MSLLGCSVNRGRLLSGFRLKHLMQKAKIGHLTHVLGFARLHYYSSVEPQPVGESGRERKTFPVSEENKALLRRFYDEFFNGGNLDVANEIIAPDCPLYFALYFGSTFMGTGPEAFKQTRTMMHAGFPDLHWTIEEMVAEGEKVAERLSARGTHEGEFMGVAPTGKRVEFQGQAIFHISKGKVLECRVMPDMLSLMQQIGAVLAPEQSEEASPT